ncbi:hypothetical protein [Klebsiella pneumoniae IS46]|nr:hypothetical protein [Klebsiella pneumoniae IS46]
MQLRIIFQYRQVDVSHQLQQRSVLRNFLLVHGRHGLRKVLPNLISRDGVRHDVLPPVNTSWSVGKLPRGGGEEFTNCDGDNLPPAQVSAQNITHSYEKHPVISL